MEGVLEVLVDVIISSYKGVKVDIELLEELMAILKVL